MDEQTKQFAVIKGKKQEVVDWVLAEIAALAPLPEDPFALGADAYWERAERLHRVWDMLAETEKRAIRLILLKR